MTEQATRRSLARRRFLLGLDRPACRPDCPDAEPSGRGRDPRAIGPAAPPPYRRDAPLGLLCRRPLPAARPCDAATHHLRDWRDNTQLPVDPKLLDLLWSLRARPGYLRTRSRCSAATARPRPTPCCAAPAMALPATACTCGRWRSTCRWRADRCAVSAAPPWRSEAAAWATIHAPASSTSTRATSATGEPSAAGRAILGTAGCGITRSVARPG